MRPRRVFSVMYSYFKAIAIAAALMCLASAAGQSVAQRNIYYQEAEAFLQSIPDSLQQKQTRAVRQAIGGEYGPLRQVRQSRDVAHQLPSTVTATTITDRLTLFRSSRYDGKDIPLLVYLHGGGWTFGSINSCARFCAALAEAGIAVLAVNYRLAPENPYPAALSDCIAAADTAHRNLARWHCSSLAIGGDSSGGNLAIATALSQPTATFSALVTFYPVTKAYPDSSASWQLYGSGYGLDSDLMTAFNNAYTTENRSHDPLVSPAMAADEALAALPPLLMISADRDILRDQGSEFVRRLSRLGKQAEHHILPGSVHLFITVPGQQAAFGYSVSAAAEFIRSHSGH